MNAVRVDIGNHFEIVKVVFAVFVHCTLIIAIGAFFDQRALETLRHIIRSVWEPVHFVRYFSGEFRRRDKLERNFRRFRIRREGVKYAYIEQHHVAEVFRHNGNNDIRFFPFTPIGVGNVYIDGL